IMTRATTTTYSTTTGEAHSITGLCMDTSLIMMTLVFSYYYLGIIYLTLYITVLFSLFYIIVPFSTLSIDPCYNYTSLDEPWRATDNPYYNNYYYYGMCDYNVEWNGWYRMFYNGQNTQMPESCVNYGMCGTYNPLSLNGIHPQLEDGVVTRQVCLPWSGCCTYASHPIRVKACPGNYYVYEFVKPMFCGAYCEVNIHFFFFLFRQCFGCFYSPSDFSETCESSSGSMSVSRCQLFEAGFSADVLHLNDPNCKGTVRNGKALIYKHFRWWLMSKINRFKYYFCGSQANGTHFIYSNFILGTPRSEGLISREKILKLPFSCVYPQTQTLSMNVEINPLESIKIISMKIMHLEHFNSIFTRPFTGRVDAELDQKMNVEVRVEGVDSRQFALVMDTCWATPVNDPDYKRKQFDLSIVIVNILRCPNPNDDTVELLQNGVSTSSRFSFRMFIFTANSTKLYLHCTVHLCLLSSNRCSTVLFLSLFV
uniref:ZP domain-containing protein n=1 Tax=Cyprinus carpio carpio TaxID=630221 RepID=A0A8C1BQY0_CYPCA